jgi:CheY-like chemotaxis protein
MFQITVCDDNIDELSNMVQLIDLYRTSKHLNCEYAVFSNGFELVSALEKEKRFNIYCLDIIMPGFTGIDAAKEIRNSYQTELIFHQGLPVSKEQGHGFGTKAWYILWESMAVYSSFRSRMAGLYFRPLHKRLLFPIVAFYIVDCISQTVTSEF